MRNKPARAFRDGKNQKQKQQRGNCAEAEHHAPCVVIGQPVSYEICQGDADGERELVKANEHATRLRWGEFGNIDRRGDGGESDGNSEQHSPHEYGENIRGERGQDRSNDKEHTAP
jgi:hypothetical protein